MILYLADNGSPKWGITAPLDPARGKGTAYEGGVHVPFIASGPGVARAGGETEALVSFADVFPTLAELAGVDLATWVPPGGGHEGPLELDGESLVPLFQDPSADTARSVVLAEAFTPPGGGPYTWTRHTAVSAGWKYVLLEGEESTGDPDVEVREELYRLVPNDPAADSWILDEGPDLLAEGTLDADAQAAYNQLSAALDDELASRPFEY